MLSQAWAAKQRMLGAEHPETLIGVGNLASTYAEQGRYDEAQALFERVLEPMQRVLGVEHPRTLISMSNLATLCLRQGRLRRSPGPL